MFRFLLVMLAIVLFGNTANAQFGTGITRFGPIRDLRDRSFLRRAERVGIFPVERERFAFGGFESRCIPRSPFADIRGQLDAIRFRQDESIAIERENRNLILQILARRRAEAEEAAFGFPGGFGGGGLATRYPY